MIGNSTHLRTHYRVEASVSDDAILDALYYANRQLAGMVGAANYAEVESHTEWHASGTVQIGGESYPFEGFDLLVEAGAVAHLIATQDVVVTSFGIVHKRDEYSEHADTYWPAKTYELHYREGVAAFCQWVGWRYTTPDTTPTTTRFFEQ